MDKNHISNEGKPKSIHLMEFFDEPQTSEASTAPGNNPKNGIELMAFDQDPKGIELMAFDQDPNPADHIKEKPKITEFNDNTSDTPRKPLHTSAVNYSPSFKNTKNEGESSNPINIEVSHHQFESHTSNSSSEQSDFNQETRRSDFDFDDVEITKPKPNKRLQPRFEKFVPMQKPKRTSLQQVLTADAVIDKKKEKRPTAADIAKHIMNCVHLKVIDNTLHIYEQNHYKALNNVNSKILIMRHCTALVDLAGTGRIVDDAYGILLMRAELQAIADETNSALIAFDNGILNIYSGGLFPASPEYFLRLNICCAYDTNATFCPIFSKLLYDISGGDPVIQDLIWEFTGYCLTPTTGKKVIFVLQGVSNSGKSLLINIISSFLSKDNHTSISLSDFEQTFGLADIYGKHLIFIHELPSEEIRPKAVSWLKKLTSSDEITIDIKYENRKRFVCKSKIICTSNNAIKLVDPDGALFKRMVVIPFQYSVDPQKMDYDLLEKIQTEKSAIFNIALGHYKKFLMRNKHFCKYFPLNMAVENVEKRSANDVCDDIYEFIYANIVKDESCFVFSDDLKADFEKQFYKLTDKDFYSKLSFVIDSLPFTVTKTKKRKIQGSNPQSCYLGIRLKGKEEHFEQH